MNIPRDGMTSASARAQQEMLEALERELARREGAEQKDDSHRSQRSRRLDSRERSPRQRHRSRGRGDRVPPPPGPPRQRRFRERDERSPSSRVPDYVKRDQPARHRVSLYRSRSPSLGSRVDMGGYGDGSSGIAWANAEDKRAKRRLRSPEQKGEFSFAIGRERGPQRAAQAFPQYDRRKALEDRQRDRSPKPRRSRSRSGGDRQRERIPEQRPPLEAKVPKEANADDKDAAGATTSAEMLMLQCLGDISKGNPPPSQPAPPPLPTTPKAAQQYTGPYADIYTRENAQAALLVDKVVANHAILEKTHGGLEPTGNPGMLRPKKANSGGGAKITQAAALTPRHPKAFVAETALNDHYGAAVAAAVQPPTLIDTPKTVVEQALPPAQAAPEPSIDDIDDSKPEEELRMDPTDGALNPKEIFIGLYGEEAGLKEWETATRELRVDKADGQPYPRASFVDLYGGTKEWKTARRLSQEEMLAYKHAFDAYKETLKAQQQIAESQRQKELEKEKQLQERQEKGKQFERELKQSGIKPGEFANLAKVQISLPELEKSHEYKEEDIKDHVEEFIQTQGINQRVASILRSSHYLVQKHVTTYSLPRITRNPSGLLHANINEMSDHYLSLNEFVVENGIDPVSAGILLKFSWGIQKAVLRLPLMHGGTAPGTLDRFIKSSTLLTKSVDDFLKYNEIDEQGTKKLRDADPEVQREMLRENFKDRNNKSSALLSRISQAAKTIKYEKEHAHLTDF